jgi:predicted nucleotidyltransferase
MMNPDDRVKRAADLAVERSRTVLESQRLDGPPGAPVFLSISGAHIYGFPSEDSDIDLRGAHLLPLETVVGLATPVETWESDAVEIDGIPMDCVTHDLRKYLQLMTRRNGYILEQVFSPLVVFDSGNLDELRSLALGALTRTVVHHYRGFFRKQEQKVTSAEAPSAKSVLYLFRVAMTGLYLLRERRVVTDLRTLNNAMFGLPFIDDLIARKMDGGEHSHLDPTEAQHYVVHAKKLESQFDPTAEASDLPEQTPNLNAINDFLLRLRLQPTAWTDPTS